jgi:hypothetical protein
MSMGDNSIDDMHGIMRTCTACGMYRDMYRGGVRRDAHYLDMDEIGLHAVICMSMCMCMYDDEHDQDCCDAVHVHVDILRVMVAGMVLFAHGLQIGIVFYVISLW